MIECHLELTWLVIETPNSKIPTSIFMDRNVKKQGIKPIVYWCKEISDNTPNLGQNSKDNIKACSNTFSDRLIVSKIRKCIKKNSRPIYICERLEH